MSASVSSGLGPAILFGTVILAVGAAIIGSVVSARRKNAIAPKVVPFIKANFAVLANDQGEITEESLFAAQDKFPNNAAEIAFIQAHLSDIGEANGKDTTAQGSTAIVTAVVDPMVTPLAMAGFNTYSITKERADKLSHITMGTFGGVHVWVFD